MEEQPTRDEFMRQFLEKIRTMPPHEAIEELMGAMDIVVKILDRDSLLEMRAMIAKLHPNSPEIIDLIDGNLALREIQTPD
jgi:hypothetical protein